MVLFFGSRRAVSDATIAVGEPADRALIIALLECEQRARDLRHRMFDGAAINESTWLLLQDLFAAHLAGKKVRTKELCSMSGLPQTTVLRYLDHLQDFALIDRESDLADSRVTLVSLSEAGANWLQHYYSELVNGELRLLHQAAGLSPLVHEEGAQLLDLR